MSRFPRLRRRPGEWADVHERARARAAERLDGPLGLAESTWLDEHLAACPSCAAIAAAYQADRQALRALRDQQPDPPRDLWARTAAAIEQLSIESGATEPNVEPAPASPGRTGGPRGLPLGAMSAVAVVLVVVGATLLSRGVGPRVGGDVTPSGAGRSVVASLGPPEITSGAGAEPTPFAVIAGDVAWVDLGPNGVGFSSAQVDEVCPEGSSGCPAIQDQGRQQLALRSTPHSLIGSPSKQQAVAIAKAADSGDEVVVVELPKRTPAASASPSPSASLAPSPSESAEPSDAEETGAPSPSVTIEVSPSASALQSPEPTTAADLAIARGILVVGESAAFSPDGTWFAFTARPTDASRGPDVWVWRVGDPEAQRLTDDGTSYFASWAGDQAVVSRPADPSSESTAPASVVIDPSTGDEQAVGEVWRPMIDPRGIFAIGWRGTLERSEDPLIWAPADGRLELRTWSSVGDGGAPDGSEGRFEVADSAKGDFDVRWDETGEWVAVWVGDERDASTGRLTLYHVDTQRGRLEKVRGVSNVRSLPGFSIGSGRLAWVTPRGQGGEGSRVQIAAWSAGGVGIVESTPGEDVRIIR